MKLGVIRYGAGNIYSLQSAIKRLGADFILSEDVAELNSCDKLIFPGVGSANFAMSVLKEKGLDRLIIETEKAFLGICLGMQLLCSASEENQTPCLGIFPMRVKQFKGDNLKVPHMGWNRLQNEKTALFQSVQASQYMYFVHSYYVENSEFSIATANYGTEFSAAIRFRNYYAVQFHPEKSSQAGFQLLQNFIYGDLV